jgi:amidase
VHHDRVGGAPTEWREAFRLLQGAEAWEAHRDWLATAPPLSAPVRARFEAAAKITPDEVAAAAHRQAALAARLDELIGPTQAALVPAAGTEPVPADADDATVDAARQACMAATCLASLTGRPSVAVPVPDRPLPVGIALIAPRHGDESLLALAARLVP